MIGWRGVGDGAWVNCILNEISTKDNTAKTPIDFQKSLIFSRAVS